MANQRCLGTKKTVSLCAIICLIVWWTHILATPKQQLCSRDSPNALGIWSRASVNERERVQTVYLLGVCRFNFQSLYTFRTIEYRVAIAGLHLTKQMCYSTRCDSYLNRKESWCCCSCQTHAQKTDQA